MSLFVCRNEGQGLTRLQRASARAAVLDSVLYGDGTLETKVLHVLGALPELWDFLERFVGTASMLNHTVSFSLTIRAFGLIRKPHTVQL